ncbi:BQ5605_C002g01464 [Microbotryum silenes-dioicae]|uniref:BQ5605_C002g01464 protein n=1 Tax=Microbotryum silenes-dioicae TaxID=796604 RepID=A0A2X0NWD4_9BASI|nr:BQ5605_C002g01464 [Microbotryum silenes-dioicae]
MGAYCALAMMDRHSMNYSQTGTIRYTLAHLTWRWTIISAMTSAIGVAGTLTRRAPLLRIFAVGTSFDLVCTIVLLLVFLLVTFSPTLAEPFSSFLCSALTSGEFASVSTLKLWESESQVGPEGFGIELLNFGIEACEEHWRGGMVALILGAIIAVALRTLGTIVTWDYHSTLVKQKLWLQEIENGEPLGLRKEQGWYDAESITSSSAFKGLRGGQSDEESGRRKRSPTTEGRYAAHRERRRSSFPSTSTRPTRANTLPVMFAQQGSGIASSSSPSSRHRLVFVPVYLDRNTTAVAEPLPRYSSSVQLQHITSASAISDSAHSTVSAHRTPESSPPSSRTSSRNRTSPTRAHKASRSSRPVVPSLASHIASAASIPFAIDTALAPERSPDAVSSASSSSTTAFDWPVEGANVNQFRARLLSDSHNPSPLPRTNERMGERASF